MIDQSTYRRVGYVFAAIAAAAFVVIVIRALNQCAGDEDEKNKFLSIIQNDQNQIEQVRLSKSAPGWDVNLVNKEWVINDGHKIDSLRNYVVYRKEESWQKPRREWEILMTFVFKDGYEFGVVVTKVSNASVNGRTHMYFQTGPCSDAQPSYSDELGIYLENLVKYDGRKFR